jgi:hypothetical protein
VEGMTITLNGQPYSVGNLITNPGTNILVITSDNGDYRKEYTFTINLLTSGFTNGSTYENEAKTITFSGGTATLNGDPFVSGTEVSEVGNYELIITGVNGFQETFNFTIKPDVRGISEGINYSGSTDIEVIGNGLNMTMNGELFNNRIFTDPGQHELIISAAGGYLQTIHFRIIPIVSGGVIAGQDYINTSVNIQISGGNPTLNGVSIPLTYTVNEVGHYTLVLPQNNLPNYELSFSILPDVNGVRDNRTYTGSVTPTILGNGMIVTLNDKPYVSGTYVAPPPTIVTFQPIN